MNGVTGAGSKQYKVSNITYDPFGGMKSYQYSNGVTTTVTRDNQYRTTGISTGTDQIMNRTYTYDNVGNILTIPDSLNAQKNQTFGYDNLYRLTTANGIWGNGSFTYDNVGNRLSKVVGASTTNYTYATGKNRLASSTGAEVATYSYNSNGNITGDGSLTFQYNQNSRLKEITGTGVKQTNVYDGMGKRVRVMNNAPDPYLNFIYDIFGNLISEDGFKGLGDIVDVEYVYLNGIPVIKVEQNDPSPSICWDFETSGSCNTTLWDKGGIGYDQTTISRDSAAVISGTYSEKMYVLPDYTGTVNSGFLGLTKTQIETTHRYLDLWVWSDTAQNTEVKVEVRYGSQCGQTDHITILSYTNAQMGWNHVSADLLSIVNYIEQTYGAYLDLQIRVYNWHGNTIWLDDVTIHQYLIGEKGYFIHSDHLGTPQVMTDSSKAVAWQADYLPFGDIYQQSGTASLSFRFPGQYQDRTTVYQNGFRDYNPKVGRYMEADPILQPTYPNVPFLLTSLIKTPQELMPYNYVGQNPVNEVDPTGEKCDPKPSATQIFKTLNDSPNQWLEIMLYGKLISEVRKEVKCKCTEICTYSLYKKWRFGAMQPSGSIRWGKWLTPTFFDNLVYTQSCN